MNRTQQPAYPREAESIPMGWAPPGPNIPLPQAPTCRVTPMSHSPIQSGDATRVPPVHHASEEASMTTAARVDRSMIPPTALLFCHEIRPTDPPQHAAMEAGRVWQPQAGVPTAPLTGVLPSMGSLPRRVEGGAERCRYSSDDCIIPWPQWDATEEPSDPPLTLPACELRGEWMAIQPRELTRPSWLLPQQRTRAQKQEYDQRCTREGRMPMLLLAAQQASSFRYPAHVPYEPIQHLLIWRALSLNKHLRELTAIDVHLGAAGGEALYLTLCNHPQLACLRLGEVSGLDPEHDTITPLVLSLPALRELILWGLGPATPVLYQLIQQVADRALPLQRLTLGLNRLQPQAAAPLRALLLHCPALVELNLRGNRLDNAAIQTLASGMHPCCSLQVLNLESNQFTTAGAQALAEAITRNGHGGQLRLLNVSGNHILGLGALALVEASPEGRPLHELILNHALLKQEEPVGRLLTRISQNSSVTKLALMGSCVGRCPEPLALAITSNTTR